MVERVKLGAIKPAPSQQTHHGALEFAHIRANVGGNEKRDIRGQQDVLALGLFLQNSYLGLQVGRLNIGDQSPFEATAQAVLDLWQLLRRTIRSDDNLPHALVERIERMKELFLGALLLGKELDVVNEQQIDKSETCRESWSFCHSAAS